MLTPNALPHYLILALILFIIGASIIIMNKNLVKILVGVCFMFNAALINFTAANAFLRPENSLINLTEETATLASAFAPIRHIKQNFTLPDGQAAAVIIIFLGLIEILIGFALIFAAYLRYQKSDTSMLYKECKKGEEECI